MFPAPSPGGQNLRFWSISLKCDVFLQPLADQAPNSQVLCSEPARPQTQEPICTTPEQDPETLLFFIGILIGR